MVIKRCGESCYEGRSVFVVFSVSLRSVSSCGRRWLFPSAFLEHHVDRFCRSDFLSSASSTCLCFTFGDYTCTFIVFWSLRTGTWMRSKVCSSPCVNSHAHTQACTQVFVFGLMSIIAGWTTSTVCHWCVQWLQGVTVLWFLSGS